MYSILVLFVQEEFFQTEAEGRTEATKVTEEKFGTSLRLAFCPLMGQELTLWRFICETFLRTFWRTYFYAAS